MDALDAQLDYVNKVKSDLERREAAMKTTQFAQNSHRRAVAVVTSSGDLVARERARRLHEETRAASARLRDYLDQGERRLDAATETLHSNDVAALRLKLAGLVGVAQRLEDAVDFGRLSLRDDGEYDDPVDDETLQKHAADCLRALEHEIRRAGRWFEDLRALVHRAADAV
jgi:hypothetical protein